MKSHPSCCPTQELNPGSDGDAQNGANGAGCAEACCRRVPGRSGGAGGGGWWARGAVGRSAWSPSECRTRCVSRLAIEILLAAFQGHLPCAISLQCLCGASAVSDANPAPESSTHSKQRQLDSFLREVITRGTSDTTGYGPKYRRARMQPPTLSPEDSDAAASAAHAPYTRMCAAEAVEA